MKKSVDRLTPAVSQTKAVKQPQHAYESAHSAALGLTRAFGCTSQDEAPAIDVIIMARLNAALNSIDDALQTACFQRGLLPRIVGESLRMACFLSQVLPMARAAQSTTGVPASILVAEAYVVNTGNNFASMQDAFLARARELREEPAFQKIMRATGDARIGMTSSAYPSNFLALIAAWSKNKYGVELVDTIVSHDLLECDRIVPVV
jgi:hypothetical protein